MLARGRDRQAWNARAGHAGRGLGGALQDGAQASDRGSRQTTVQACSGRTHSRQAAPIEILTRRRAGEALNDDSACAARSRRTLCDQPSETPDWWRPSAVW